MTLIEFFERDPIENICSCFACKPDRVILIGDNYKPMRVHQARYEALFAERGWEIPFRCFSINRNQLPSIVEKLTELVEEYDDCVFDLTGGEDLYLVAVGMVYAAHPHRNIQLHRINIRNNTVYDCDMDGRLLLEHPPLPLSVEELIRIHGGDVVYDDQRETGTHRWIADEEFLSDIDRMWEVCRKDIRGWNQMCKLLDEAETLRWCSPDPLTTLAPLEKPVTNRNMRILNGLTESGLLTDLRIQNGNLTVSYKNQQVKRCLTKAGQALEMIIWRAAGAACESDGTKSYHDVVNGVVIDWDGELADFYTDTENEIDVLMTHDMVPVFVSCKNGFVDKNELYKFHAVATCFGGKYAKKILVAPALEQEPNEAYIRQRAADLGIAVVTDILEADSKELQRTVSSFWRRS